MRKADQALLPTQVGSFVGCSLLTAKHGSGTTFARLSKGSALALLRTRPLQRNTGVLSVNAIDLYCVAREWNSFGHTWVWKCLSSNP